MCEYCPGEKVFLFVKIVGEDTEMPSLLASLREKKKREYSLAFVPARQLNREKNVEKEKDKRLC